MLLDMILIGLAVLWTALRLYCLLRIPPRQRPLLAKTDHAAARPGLRKAELPNPPRRRFQFTLRMLMVVVTATCLVGGILRWLTPISPLYACIASMWVAVAAVIICQFDLRKL
jgi:hypothetical protein